MLLSKIILSKATTGLAGIPVHPEARSALITVFKETLEALKNIPESAVYRKSVSQQTKQRLNIVEGTSDIPDIESKMNSSKLGFGQIEEILIQARDELNLVYKMVEWKPWEELEVKPSAEQWEYFKSNKSNN